jgi:hypothetical protein
MIDNQHVILREGLLVLASLRVNDEPVDLLGVHITKQSRGAPPTLIEWMILAYVIGETILFSLVCLYCHCFY